MLFHFRLLLCLNQRMQLFTPHILEQLGHCHLFRENSCQHMGCWHPSHFQDPSPTKSFITKRSTMVSRSQGTEPAPAKDHGWCANSVASAAASAAKVLSRLFESICGDGLTLCLVVGGMPVLNTLGVDRTLLDSNDPAFGRRGAAAMWGVFDLQGRKFASLPCSW